MKYNFSLPNFVRYDYYILVSKPIVYLASRVTANYSNIVKSKLQELYHYNLHNGEFFVCIVVNSNGLALIISQRSDIFNRLGIWLYR